MLTGHKQRNWKVAVVGFVVLASTLVGGGRAAFADPANLTDPNDTSSKLDISAGAVTNTPSTVTYTLTMDSFVPSDVSRVIFEYDFSGDGVADNCLRVTQSSTPSGLEGVVYDGCSGSNLVGTADSVSVVSGNQLRVVVNNQVLRDAGLNNSSSYTFRVLTLDVPSASNPPPFANDTAPDTGFVTHNLGTLVCGGQVGGKVNLTQDITGCRGDGLSVTKNGTKINLNGYKIESAYVGSPPSAGIITGVKAGAFKTVSISNGTISGFGTGVSFNNSLNSKDKKKQSYVKTLTLSGNTDAVNVVGGKYVNLTSNTITGSKGVGISITGSKHKVQKNNVSGSTGDGIRSASGDGITFKENTSSTNGTQPPNATALTGDGIDIDSTKAKVSLNTANTNDGDGLSAPADATGSGNSASGNAGVDCAPAAIC